MNTTKSLLVLAILAASVSSVQATVVTFDDQPQGTVLTGTTYAGLTWEVGNAGYQSNLGAWVTAANPAAYSGPNVVTNKMGCSLLGIGFGSKVDVSGAYFMKQGTIAVDSVRAHGYSDGSEVAVTGWFNLTNSPNFFAMNLSNIDRIVLESKPDWYLGYGWYAMDDLTYTPEPATIALLGLGGLAMAKRRK